MDHEAHLAELARTLFADDRVDLPRLRERAHNLRWAEVEPDVIPLTAADPDFPVAVEIREAIAGYVASGVLSYGPAEGLADFRETVAQGLRERRRVPAEASRVMATNSAAAAMAIVARAVLEPGDEAIVFDPVDFLFATSAEHAGAAAVRVPLDPSTGALDEAALRRAITPRTRLIGVCNPHNPLGRVLPREELEAIAQVALEHDLWLMSDEVWSDVVYAPHPYTSLASLGPQVAARTFTVYGFSKGYGLAGLRIGYLHAPTAAAFERAAQVSAVRTTIDGVSTLSQVAAVAAWTRAQDWKDAFVLHLQGLRDEAVARLAAMGLPCTTPQGTYVLFPDVRGLGLDPVALVARLRAEARLALVPGAPRWFGPGAQGHVRICFSTSRGILHEGLDRLEGWLARA